MPPFTLGVTKNTLGMIKNDPFTLGMNKKVPFTLGVTKHTLGMIKNDPFTLGVTKNVPFTLGVTKMFPFTLGVDLQYRFCKNVFLLADPGSRPVRHPKARVFHLRPPGARG